MSETTQTSAPPQGAPETQATPAAQPPPGSAEHRAAMIAAYDAQFATQAPDATSAGAPAQQPATQAQTATQQQLSSDPATAEKPAEQADSDKPSGDPEKGAAGLPELFASGDLVSGFNAEALPPSVAAAFKATGLDDSAIQAIHQQFRAGQLALQREQLGSLHTAAGGKAQFDALVAWGQKNLTQEQREFYDAQLNGPSAADAIAVLRQRMSAGADPRITLGNGPSAPAVSGFRDKAEMIAAMQHPDYQRSEAYRADVQRKLAAATF